MRRLQCFLAVAEELNFRKAAKKIPIAQAALSTQIRKLEEKVGAKLFIRNTHSVQLTEAGRVYRKAAKRALRTLDQGRDEAQRIHLGEKGSLRIGVVASLYQSTLPKMLRNFQDQYPDIEIESVERNPEKQINELRKGKLDVAFLGKVDAHENDPIVTQPIDSFRLALAVDESHRLAGRKSVKLTDLKDETILCTSETYAPVYNEWLEELLAEHGIDATIKRRRGRALTILQQVRLGKGLAVFPEPFYSKSIPRLSVIPFARQVEQYPSSIGYRRNEEAATVLRFINFVTSSEQS